MNLRVGDMTYGKILAYRQVPSDDIGGSDERKMQLREAISNPPMR